MIFAGQRLRRVDRSQPAGAHLVVRTIPSALDARFSPFGICASATRRQERILSERGSVQLPQLKLLPLRSQGRSRRLHRVNRMLHMLGSRCSRSSNCKCNYVVGNRIVLSWSSANDCKCSSRLDRMTRRYVSHALSYI